MEDALDIVKHKADYITLSNNEDGIKIFLEIMLIKPLGK